MSLTFHRRSDRARCHYCGYSRSRPERCPECTGAYLEQVGFGTERVEADIAERWPGARVARLDRDTVRRQGAAARLLNRFGAGELDVLVGTQMVAKGHDFPRVTLVGVISADVGLGVADFRAGERTFQLLTQVAGRAGRGTLPGEAIVQTLYPNHYSIRYACRQAYEPFFADEMEFRTAMHYPPEVALVSAVVRAPTFNQAMQDAAELAQGARGARQSIHGTRTSLCSIGTSAGTVSGSTPAQRTAARRNAAGAPGYPRGPRRVKTAGGDRRRSTLDAVVGGWDAPRSRCNGVEHTCRDDCGRGPGGWVFSGDSAPIQPAGRSIRAEPA